MNKVLYILLLSIATWHPATGQSKDEAVIAKLLATQEAAWNRGSIDGFMKGYWNNDSLIFIGSKGPRYGYDAALKRYKETYPDAAQMGRLSMNIIRMQQLAPDYYFIVGKWALKRTVGNIGGSFTLLMRKIKGEWMIVCDHSS